MPGLTAADGRRIFLMDAMSFIFRAYHAMARQRGMSTKTGLPTAATYVFVNMLRKLREDFSPEYLAAVFDVAAPTFRDTAAEAVTKVRKFDMKTQTFQEVEYHGYKANRSEMPAELVQQVPYIRRALEAYRIPILELAGYEADDVIGTLARKAAAQSYLVYVVSSDKDMLQLVNDRVLVLNPPKDNLICDAQKGGRNSRRAAGARHRCHGPARRLRGQYSRRSGNRRQGFGRTHPALRHGRAGARPRRGSREEVLPRIAAEQSRQCSLQQAHGDHRLRCPGRSGS